jgi:site-specific recombinase XerD
MPEGACVIERAGKRGVVWYVKYRDADGRQVKERLGRSVDGWNRKKAEAELRSRVVAVEKAGYRKPEPITFASLAKEWLESYPDTRGLKRSTRRSYEQIVVLHLEPTFGKLRPADVTVEAIEKFIAAKLRAGYAPASVNRQLNVLSLLMRAAVKRRLATMNPISLVDRPRESQRRWRILSPSETVGVERAFDQLLAKAKSDRDKEDTTTVRVLFLTLMATGIRRGEALGLRWRSVLLADPDGPVMRIEETWVKNGPDTPKSRAGHRTISLGRRISAELFDHRGRTRFSGDDEFVFCNPRTGRPFGDDRYAEILRKALAMAGIDDYVRPSHDLRHSSITNAAAAGTPPEALMSRAGHSAYSTTKRYIDLAGERFREEADRLEQRLWGRTGTKNRYQKAASSPNRKTKRAREGLG